MNLTELLLHIKTIILHKYTHTLLLYKHIQFLLHIKTIILHKYTQTLLSYSRTQFLFTHIINSFTYETLFAMCQLGA